MYIVMIDLQSMLWKLVFTASWLQFIYRKLCSKVHNYKNCLVSFSTSYLDFPNFHAGNLRLFNKCTWKDETTLSQVIINKIGSKPKPNRHCCIRDKHMNASCTDLYIYTRLWARMPGIRRAEKAVNFASWILETFRVLPHFLFFFFSFWVIMPSHTSGMWPASCKIK